MTRTSCVPRYQDDDFVIIRRSYLAICNGDPTAAALIHIFEQWHNTKLAARQNHIDVDPDPARETPLPLLWQYHKSEDLERALLGVGKRHSIDQAKKMLVEMGIIEIGRNPNKKYKFDATTYYLFHPEIVIQLLQEKSPFAEISTDNSAENSSDKGPIGAENSNAINIDSPGSIDSKKTKNTVTAPERGDKKVKDAKDKNTKLAPPPREHWQALVDTWFDFYKSKHGGEEPSFVGRQTGLFGKLVDLLLARAKKKAKQLNKDLQWTAEYACGSLKFFLELAWSEDWLQKHFLLTNLVEQFDAVYAREAVKKQQKQPAAAQQAHTNPYGGGQRSVNEELDYLLGRYAERDFDRRIVEERHYDMLTGRSILPIGTMDRFEGETPEDKKINAVLGWLKSMTKTAAQ